MPFQRKIIKPSSPRRKETIASIKQVELIGGRLEGKVHSVNVVLSRGNKSRTLRMAEKSFEPLKGIAAERVRRAISSQLKGSREPKDLIEIMGNFRKIGLPAIPTFRLAVDEHGKQTLLMTDLRKLGMVFDFFVHPQENYLLCGIANYPELKQRILNSVRIANQNDYFLAPDAWLLIMRKHNGNYKAEPVIVDIGNSGAATKMAIGQNREIVEDYFRSLEELYSIYLRTRGR